MHRGKRDNRWDIQTTSVAVKLSLRQKIWITYPRWDGWVLDYATWQIFCRLSEHRACLFRLQTIEHAVQVRRWVKDVIYPQSGIEFGWPWDLSSAHKNTLESSQTIALNTRRSSAKMEVILIRKFAESMTIFYVKNRVLILKITIIKHKVISRRPSSDISLYFHFQNSDVSVMTSLSEADVRSWESRKLKTITDQQVFN